MDATVSDGREIVHLSFVPVSTRQLSTVLCNEAAKKSHPAIRVATMIGVHLCTNNLGAYVRIQSHPRLRYCT